MDVKKGVPVPIEVRYTARVTLADQAREMFATTMGPVVKLSHAPASALIQNAVDAARKADVAVVFAGHIVGEGMDRARLGLPPIEDALIEAVANVNPRTVVVLTTGGAVTMPWLSKVAGVLEMWLPGNSFGTAAAQLLFGDAAPGGRLPVTFPLTEAQGPGQSIAEYPGTPDRTGAPADVHFDEGLVIGYRYWNQHGQTPLFPFGYGLTYSNFKVSDVVLRKAGEGAVVEAAVRNTGKRTAADVIQVYVGFPKVAGEPPKQLKAFKKVTLAPGASATVDIPLGPEAFQVWDEKSHTWTTIPGNYQIMVGRSSQDLLATRLLKLGG